MHANGEMITQIAVKENALTASCNFAHNEPDSDLYRRDQNRHLQERINIQIKDCEYKV